MSDGYWWLRARLHARDEQLRTYVKKVVEHTNPCHYNGETLILRIPATAGGLAPVTAWWVDSAGDEPFLVGTVRDVLPEEPTGCADVTSALQTRRWLHWCEDEQHPAYLWEPGTGPRDVTHPDEKPTPEETHIERLARELAELDDIDSIREVMRAGVAAAEKIASDEGDDSGGQGRNGDGWKR